MTYTADDVELVARALHNHPGDVPFDYYDDAKRALDALAAASRLADVGRCGEVLSVTLRGAPTDVQPAQSVCALPAGHPGWHRSDEGTEWTNTWEPVEPENGGQG